MKPDILSPGWIFTSKKSLNSCGLEVLVPHFNFLSNWLHCSYKERRNFVLNKRIRHLQNCHCRTKGLHWSSPLNLLCCFHNLELPEWVRYNTTLKYLSNAEKSRARSQFKASFESHLSLRTKAISLNYLIVSIWPREKKCRPNNWHPQLVSQPCLALPDPTRPWRFDLICLNFQLS